MSSNLPIYQTQLRLQSATYWAPIEPNVPNGFGDITFAAPVEMIVRWQPRVDLIQDANGDEFVTEAVVYPNIEVVKGGFMSLGLFTFANPRQVETAREIREVRDSPSLHGTKRIIKAIL